MVTLNTKMSYMQKSNQTQNFNFSVNLNIFYPIRLLCPKFLGKAQDKMDPDVILLVASCLPESGPVIVR